MPRAEDMLQVAQEFPKCLKSANKISRKLDLEQVALPDGQGLSFIRL